MKQNKSSSNDMTCSYNEILSRKFSRQARDAIKEQQRIGRIVFCDVFPNVKIKRGSAAVNMWAIDGNNEENYLATSPKATTTGIGADFIIIDDIVRGNYEAYHQGILQERFEWFTDTLYSRLEGKRKLILIMTRWATRDLAGRLIELYSEQGRKFKLISKRAFDGEKMLNDSILSFEQYQYLIQTIGEDTVQANYNQMPVDLKGALYSEFMTYDKLPQTGYVQRFALCDPADEGDDYLCMISYAVIKGFAYVLDVYYTKQNMSVTEKEIPKRLKAHDISILYYENNFGGSAIKRNLLKECTAIDYTRVAISEFTQTKNKQARIFAFASIATKYIYMPAGWKDKYPDFYKEITCYQREGKNAHDDGADVLTGICERIAKNIEPYAR